MATDTTQTTTAPAAEPKETIAQKVDKLNAEKTTLTGNLASLADGPEKVATAERIAVIDRKLRWYAGRSGDGKKGASNRPSRQRQAKAPKATAPASTSSAPASGSAANES